MAYFFQVIPIFLLIFCRITSFFVVVPILSSRNVPMMFKIGLSVFISLIIFATMGLDKPIPMDGEYILLIIREMLDWRFTWFSRLYLFYSCSDGWFFYGYANWL